MSDTNYIPSWDATPTSPSFALWLAAIGFNFLYTAADMVHFNPYLRTISGNCYGRTFSHVGTRWKSSSPAQCPAT